MKVYHPEGSNMTTMVTPGAFHPDVSDWHDEKTKLPIRFDVAFKNGVAEVDKKLGEWLIKNGYANRTRLRQIKNTVLRAAPIIRQFG